MKRTNTAIKAAGFLFFAALVAYLAVYVAQSVEDPLKTVQAVSYTILESADADGIVVRDEEVLYSVYDTVYVTADDGRRVTKGTQVATAFNNTDDLERTVRAGELKAQIEQLEAMVQDGSSAEDMLKLDGRITDEILALRRAVYARELGEAEELSLKLRTLTFMGSGSRSDIENEIYRLSAQLNELQRHESTDTVPIEAPSSGVFGKTVDGLETLSPDMLTELTPSQLRSMMEQDGTPPARALGKLVYGTKWYYAAMASQEDCLNLRQGRELQVQLGRYYNEELTMKVESISAAEDGRCAVVFSCDNSLSAVLNARRQNAQLVFVRQEGIRVPRKSIHVDGEGTHVYVRTGMQAERKSVNILRDYGDFYVVESDELRAGDDVIVNAKKLRDGKVVA